MKKILNILGYVSLISIPVLVITFILMFYTEVKVMNIIAFTIITIAQIIHYKKTKIKYIGIRILITLITTIICWVIIYNGYGIFKNIQIKSDLDTIDKIQIGNNEIDREYLKNNTRFVKDNFIITKGSKEVTIYYNDGRIEQAIMGIPTIGLGIINIDGNKCYINIDLVIKEKNNENARNHWFFYDYSEKDIQNMNTNNEDFKIEYNKDKTRVISINRILQQYLYKGFRKCFRCCTRSSFTNRIV